MAEKITLSRGTHTGKNGEIIEQVLMSNTLVEGPISFSLDWDQDVNWSYAKKAATIHRESKPCVIKLDLNEETFNKLQPFLLVYHSDFDQMKGHEGHGHQIRPPSWEYMRKYQGEVLFVRFPGFDEVFTSQLLQEMGARICVGKEGEYVPLKDYVHEGQIRTEEQGNATRRI